MNRPNSPQPPPRKTKPRQGDAVRVVVAPKQHRDFQPQPSAPAPIQAPAPPPIVKPAARIVPAERAPELSASPSLADAPSVQLGPQRFKSPQLWNANRIRALAMYCSDGRWGDAFDEFCQRSLQIPRYDRFAVPGGPAWLTPADAAYHQKEDQAELDETLSRAAWEELSLLVRVHELQRIILVGHYGCAFYLERLGLDPDGCLPIQMQDLERARDAVRKRFPRLSVETYVAMRHGEELAFHGML
jgi:hypothetical protein